MNSVAQLIIFNPVSWWFWWVVGSLNTSCFIHSKLWSMHTSQGGSLRFLSHSYKYLWGCSHVIFVALISSHHIQQLLTQGVKRESNFNIWIFLRMRPRVSHFLHLLASRGTTVFLLLYLSAIVGLPWCQNSRFFLLLLFGMMSFPFIIAYTLIHVQRK